MIDARADALKVFRTETGLAELRGIIQEGDDPETATFSLNFGDGQVIRIGDIDAIWSQATMAKRLSVRGFKVKPVAAKDWRAIIQDLIVDAAERRDAPDDSYEATVLDWLRAYTKRATADRDGAAGSGEPFTDGDVLYVAATQLARFVRREYSETVKLPELRRALRDLGFERAAVHYTDERTKRRNTTSYYKAELATLDSDDE